MILAEKAMVKQLHDLILEQASISMNDKPKNDTVEHLQEIHNEVVTSRKPNPHGCSPFELIAPALPCKFGDLFLSRVKSWATKLRWPTVATGHISLLELYIDFTLSEKSLCPVPIGGSKGNKAQEYLLKDQSPKAAAIPQSLAQQSVIWARFLRWAIDCGFVFWPYPIIKQSSCLSDLGYSLWAPALGTHPILTMGDRAYLVLKSLFRTPSGKRRNLNIAYNGDTSSLLG